MEQVWRDLTDPANLFAHSSYILLILSMSMTSMKWLRILALSSGLAAMAHFTFRTQDNASFVWEAAFVTVNLVQLLMIQMRKRAENMSPEECQLMLDVLSLYDANDRRALAKLIEWHDVPEGTLLMEFGNPAPPLIYVSGGAAAAERDQRIVGVCGPGDFLGEMSLISGESASATVRVTNKLRYAEFDRDGVAKLAKNSPSVSRALESAMSRGLAAKIIRMNEAARTVAAESPVSGGE